MAARDIHETDVLGDYVDGMLGATAACEVERHLTVCLHCRSVVQQERELIERMRSFSLGVRAQDDLTAALLRLAQEVQRDQPTVVPIRRPGPATVAASAPPQYASARRSMACAVAAVAGCVGAALVAVQVPSVAQPAGGADPAVRSGQSVVRQAPVASVGDGQVRRPMVQTAVLRSARH